MSNFCPAFSASPAFPPLSALRFLLSAFYELHERVASKNKAASLNETALSTEVTFDVDQFLFSFTVLTAVPSTTRMTYIPEGKVCTSMSCPLR